MSKQDALALLGQGGRLPAKPSAPVYVLGIDLGTTNSSVAELTWDGAPSRARCLEIDQQTAEGLYTHVLVPSVVAITAEGALVGEGAKRLRSKSGELGLRQNKNLFFDSKNDIGLQRTYHAAPEG